MFDINQKISEKQAKLLNPIVLAYIGDGVHSLYVREKLAFYSDAKSGELNKREAKIVCASAQARAIGVILPQLTDDEASIYKRARNSKKPSRAKSSTVGDYAKSTGFEAVIGYLYITGQIERLNFLLEQTQGECEDNDN